MRPWATLLGVVMGSAVALLVGLGMTLVVYLLLPEFHERLAGEFRPLLAAVAWAAALVGVSTCAFVGELREWPRRYWVQVALAMLLLAYGWAYWPT